MAIQTVLGPIEPDQLGPTSMHEHLLIDATVWHRPAAEEPPEDRVSLRTRGYLQWNPLALADNLVIEDEEQVTEELRAVRAAGGSGIVDLTVIGLGRRVDRLPAISRAANLHVMVGCGFYLHDSHPTWVEAAGVDELASFLIGELNDGIEDSGIRPALIGEIGTSAPITDREKKVLRAAGRAGAETGAAVNVHLDREQAGALEAIAILVEEGMPADRIVCSHLDERLDWGYHQAVAETGAIVEYDTFGQEFYFGPTDKNPSDVERLEFVARMIEAGRRDQLVLGCDIWVKVATARYGGMGYEHLMKRIVPALSAELGLSAEEVDAIMVGTPRRLLERP
ncbi:MAG: phosphotriesterase family protein [Solirubrobacterales bacterium]